MFSHIIKWAEIRGLSSAFIIKASQNNTPVFFQCRPGAIRWSKSPQELEKNGGVFAAESSAKSRLGYMNKIYGEIDKEAGVTDIEILKIL